LELLLKFFKYRNGRYIAWIDTFSKGFNWNQINNVVAASTVKKRPV
jgi:hypothetical protein